jgi:hypothetical protein
MKMLTVPKVARLLNVTRVRVWQMLKEKKFKAVKFSHVYAEKELRKITNQEKTHEETVSNIPAV